MEKRKQLPAPVLAGAWGRWALWALLIAGPLTCAASLSGLCVPSASLALLGIFLVALLAIGVVVQSSGVFARPLVAVRTPRRELALTFDDGPDAETTPAVLRLLEEQGHRGTFFVIGERAERHLELVREIVSHGHGLGNHSLRHAYATNLAPPGRLKEELLRAGEVFAQTTGGSPRWFRPPVGLLSPRVAKAAKLAKLELVAWTASARDGVSSTSVDQAVRRLEPYLEPGAILVLHDGRVGRGRPIAAEVLEQLLPLLRERGLKSVTLDQLLAPSSGDDGG